MNLVRQKIDTLSTKRTQAFKIISVFLVVAIVFSVACSSDNTDKNDTPSGLFVVKSNTDGIITKVLVNEGATVGKDAGIVEIEVQSENEVVPVEENTRRNPATDLQAVETQVKSAEQEVKRTSVEVEKVQSLVASNSAPQAQLDAARADFQKAQERLESLKEKQRSQKTKSLIARTEKSQTTSPDTVSKEKFVIVRVPVAGVLKVINARVGQRVKKGQPLATILKN